MPEPIGAPREAVSANPPTPDQTPPRGVDIADPAAASVPGAQPSALRRYLWLWWCIGAVAGLGTLVVGLAGPGAPAWRVLLATAFFTGTQMTEIKVRLRRETYSTTLSATGVVVALVTLPANLLPPIVLVGTLIAQFAFRQPVTKTSFNCAVDLTAAFAASLAVTALPAAGGPGGLDLTSPGGLLVCLMAIAIFEGINAAAFLGLAPRLDALSYAHATRVHPYTLALSLASTAPFALLVGVLLQAAPGALAVLLLLGVAMYGTLNLHARQVTLDLQHHERLERTVAGASDGIALLDTDGVLELANPSFMQLLGLERDPTGSSLASVLPSTDREVRSLLDALEGLTPSRPEGAIEVQVGERMISADLTGLTGPDQEVTAAVMLLRDVTAQREIEGLREDFLARVSHELRTPLTVISGLVVTLRERFHEMGDEQKIDLLATVERQCRRMARLVSTLLWSAGIEAAAVQARPEPIAVSDAVERAVQHTETHRVSSGNASEPVTFTVNVAEATVLADPDHLEQMLENLLINAMRYGATPIVVEAREEDGHVVIAVCDAGPGVPATFEGHLFAPFSQATSGTRRTATGMGLGLSIVDALARQNDGSVLYRRRYGWTCFELCLPCAPRAEPGAGPVGGDAPGT